MDIVDYLDYLEFDIVRNPIDNTQLDSNEITEDY